jgi:hypothetical protein
VSLAELGYAEGATEEEARAEVERSLVTALNAGQTQLAEMRHRPLVDHGLVAGLGAEVRFVTNSTSILPLMISLERSRLTISVQHLELERRQDGSILGMLQAEAYWSPQR